MLGQQVKRAIVLQVVLKQELLVLILNEVLRVTLPRAQVNLRQEMLRHKFENLAGTILPILLFRNVACWDGQFHDLAVEVASFGNLGLQILKFDR